jgi:hypothetical protein
MGHKGNGQPVDFIATDILRVRHGRITDNWHLEDNLTFLQQDRRGDTVTALMERDACNDGLDLYSLRFK